MDIACLPDAGHLALRPLDPIMDPTIPSPELFLQYDYPETRELMKSFLTVVSATLALSVAFSEKIVRTHQADGRVRWFMLTTWCLMFAALLFGGGSIVSIAAAAGCAIYGAIPLVSCGGRTFALIAWGLGILAAILYGVSLLFMAMAGWRSLKLDAKTYQ